MQLVQTELHTLRSKSFPYEEAIIIPIADVHYGSKDADINKLKKVIEWGRKQKNVYYLGIGDMFDFSPTSVRKTLRGLFVSDDKHEGAQEILDSYMEGLLGEFYNILKPTAGRWIGAVEGNHTHVFADGESVDYKLCKMLECEYLGTSGIVQVKFQNKFDKAAGDVKIFLHHGRSTTNPIKKLEDLSSGIISDIYITGHTHLKQVKVGARMEASFRGAPRLVHKDVYYVSVGGYVKGYSEGKSRAGIPRGTYAERGMYRPLALGTSYLYLRPKKIDGDYSVDINVLI